MSRVIVIGAGNAGLSAAISAHQNGADVTVLDRGPADGSGSDSFYTGGLFRVSYENLGELEAVVGDLGMDSANGIERFSSYTEGDFLDDWGRVTGYRFDVDLAEEIVGESYEAITWLHEQGVPFISGIIIDANGNARHARPGWHGGFVEVSGAGPGLMRGLLGSVGKHGFEIVSDTEVLEIEPAEGDRSVKVHARDGDRTRKTYEADTVVLAAGGFQADSEWRTRCLGPGWDLAKVRASPFNTGAGIKMAMALGAAPHGNWSGAHAVAWSVGSGDAGSPATNHIFERESYPFGVSVNVEGRRFIDEGSDFGAYTYAKYGREILNQSEQRAWQLFDARTAEHLMDEYKQKNPYAAREKEDTLEKLAERLTDRGANGAEMLKTVAEYNAAVDDGTEFNPYNKDGRHTSGLAIDKTNWAQALVEPPFQAYEVTCGITFTFGGVRVGSDGAVLDAGKKAIPGIYAAGEMVGGLYYFNYASGTGLTSGAVLGRRAGAGRRRGLRYLMSAPQMLLDRRGVRPAPLPAPAGRVREREDSDRTVRRQLRLLASRLRLERALGAGRAELLDCDALTTGPDEVAAIVAGRLGLPCEAIVPAAPADERLLDALARSEGAGPTIVTLDRRRRRAVAGFGHGPDRGVIVLAESGRSLTDDDLRLLDSAASFLAGAHRTQRLLGEALIRDAVHGTDSPESLRVRAPQVGIDLGRGAAICLVADRTSPLSVEEVRAAASRVAPGLASHLASDAAGVLLLVPLAGGAERQSQVESVSTELGLLVRDLRSAGRPEPTAACADSVDVAGLPRALEECLALLPGREPEVVGVAVRGAEELGVVRLLLGRVPAAATDRFVAETLGAIEGEGESAKLLDTLDAFFAANGSVRATAAGLAIHENTVRHRFRRLATATGLDVLGSTDDRLTARMALTLHRLSSNAPARKEPK